jgi:hypothetical protein
LFACRQLKSQGRKTSTRFFALVQNGVRYRCAKHPSGRSGNGFKTGSGTQSRSGGRGLLTPRGLPSDRRGRNRDGISANAYRGGRTGECTKRTGAVHCAQIQEKCKN